LREARDHTIICLLKLI